MVKRAFLSPACRRAMTLAVTGLLLALSGQTADAASGIAASQTAAAQHGVEAAHQDYELARERVAAIGAQSARLCRRRRGRRRPRQQAARPGHR